MNKVRQKFGFVDLFVQGAHTRNHKYVFTNSCLFQRIPILECERPSWKLSLSLVFPMEHLLLLHRGWRPLEPPPDNEQLQQCSEH